MKSGAVFGTLFDGNAQYPTMRLTDAASIEVWKDFVTGRHNITASTRRPRRARTAREA